MALYLCVALPPLLIYLAWIASMNLRKRATMLNGSRDGLLLGLGLSGLGIAGPLELFLPEAAAFRFGPWVWVLLGVLYLLVVALVVMLRRPHLTIYNATADHVRPLIASVSRRLDPQARWVVDNLILPNLGVRLHLEHDPGMRTVQLLATGTDQDLIGWRRLEVALRRGLKDLETRRGPRGWQILAIASAMLILVVTLLLRHHQEMVRDFREFLRL